MKLFLYVLILVLALPVAVMAQAETQNPTAPFWKVKGNSGTNSGTNFIGTIDNVSLRMRTNNTERMVIDSTGYVGIGTNAPTSKVDILNGNLLVRTNANGTSSKITISGARYGGTEIWNDDPAYAHGVLDFQNYDGDASATFYTSAKIASHNGPGSDDGGLRFYTSSDKVLTEAMNIDYLGNIGIGAIPLAKLHVVGNIRMVDGNQALNKIMVSDANGTASWQTAASVFGSVAWNTTGNSSTIDGTNFIGTTDNVPVNFRMNNQKSGRISATGETFFGYQSGNANTSNHSTGFGYQALQSNTSGNDNTAVGRETMRLNTTGAANTAVGKQALAANTSGGSSNAYGYQALFSNTTGSNNNAMGSGSLWSNTTGSNNVALGYDALRSNNNSYNVAIGNAMSGSTNAYANIAIGPVALPSTNAGYNVVIGVQAAVNSTTGWSNVYIGSINVANDNVSGGSNVMVGAAAGEHNLGSGSVFLGNGAGRNETAGNKLYIENSDAATPLIYGDFATNSVTINDSLISKYFKMTSGATSTYLLQSDATGNGKWVDPATAIGSTAWSVTGNGGTTAGTNFIGTTDAIDWVVKTNNTERMRVLSTGNVGIGVANPTAARLVIDGNLSVGNNTNTVGIYSAAFGQNHTITGNGNIVGGANNRIDGNFNLVAGHTNYMANDQSIVVGNYDSCIGSSSVVFGYANKAEGFTSFVTGDHNIVLAQGGIAFGFRNLVLGDGGIAMGSSDTASGTNSTVFGQGNRAASYGEFVVGMYSTTYPGAGVSSFNLTDRIFNIGNGTGGGTRSDALTVLKNGNVGIGGAAPAQRLHINGTANGVRVGGLGTGGSFISTPAATTDKLLYADANGDINAISNGSSGQVLSINGSGVPAWATASAWGLTGNGGTTAGTNFIGTTNAVDLVIKTNNTEQMRVLSNGNIGIGTTTPGALLHLQTPNAANTPSGAIAMARYWASGSDTRASSIFHYANGLGSDRLAFAVSGDGGTYAQPNAIAQIKMVIEATGNVGINTATPAAKLDVNGTLKATAWAQQSMAASGYANMGGVIVQWGTGLYNSSAAVSVSFTTAFTNLFSITATVDVGTNTGSGANVPCKVMNSSTTGFQYAGTQVFSSDAVSRVRWIAIGN